MRPAGDIRRALERAAQSFQPTQKQPGLTWRELARMSGVGYDKARVCTRDMLRAGVLEPCGTVRVQHARRPMVLVRPAAQQRENWATATTGTDLQAVFQRWR